MLHYEAGDDNRCPDDQSDYVTPVLMKEALMFCSSAGMQIKLSVCLTVRASAAAVIVVVVVVIVVTVLVVMFVIVTTALVVTIAMNVFVIVYVF